MGNYNRNKSAIISKIFNMSIFNDLSRIFKKMKVLYKQLAMNQYAEIVVSLVEMGPDKSELKIFLPNNITNKIKEIKFYDFQGYLGDLGTFPEYRVFNDHLTIDFSKMPVAGIMAILVSTESGNFVLKYTGGKLHFGQWLISSGLKNNFIITPYSNGTVRPKRRQLLVKSLTIEDYMVLDIPFIRIDSVILLNEIDDSFKTINYELNGRTLVIDINNLPSIKGDKFQFIVRSGETNYRLFYPYSLISNHRITHYKLSNDIVKCIYSSDSGYLMFHCLTNKEQICLINEDKWKANLMVIEDNEIKLSFEQTPIMLKEDKIIARRYSNVIEFNYVFLKNVLTLKPKAMDFNLVEGFPYILEVIHNINDEIIHDPIKLVNTIKTEDGYKELSSEKIYLTNNPMENVSWQPLQITSEIHNDLIFIKSSEENCDIQKIFARYKERPVYTNITQGIDIDNLKIAYKTIRIVYKKNGLLLLDDINVTSVLDSLFK